MFCPNCGTQNADTSADCQKCGFKIKETAKPKFKGTMLMMNADPELQKLREEVQKAQGQIAAAQTPSPQSAGGIPQAAAAPGAPPTAPLPAGTGPTGTAAVPKQNFKGTMLGVAPPSIAALTAAAAPPAGTAAGAGLGATTPGGPAGINVSQVPSTAGQTPGAIAAQSADQGVPPPTPVNPLGGTMVGFSPAALIPNPVRPADPAPAPAAPGPGPQAGASGAPGFASTLPSAEPAPSRGEFASTTPSAGEGPGGQPVHAAPLASPPLIQTASMPQIHVAPTPTSRAPRPAFLITLIVVLVGALIAMGASMFKF